MADENPFSGVRLNAPSTSNASELMEAFNSFKNNMASVHMHSVISDANDQLQSIRQNTDLSAADQDTLARQLGQKTALQVASFGGNAAQENAITNSFGPKKPVIQNFMEGMTSTDPDVRQRTYDAKVKENELDMKRDAAKLTDDDGSGGLEKLKNKDDKDWFRLGRDVNDIQKGKGSATAQAQMTMQKAQNINNLVGPNQTLSDLNKLPNFSVREAGMGLASMVKNGSLTEGDIKSAIPNTVGMEAADIQTALSGMPARANAGGLVQLYLKGAQREFAGAQQQALKSVLSRYQVAYNAGLATNLPNSDSKFKNALTAHLSDIAKLDIDPSDIVVNKGMVTTTDQLEKDVAARKAQHALQEAWQSYKNPTASENDKGSANVIFNQFGLDPSHMNINQMRGVLSLMIQNGEIQKKGNGAVK